MVKKQEKKTVDYSYLFTDFISLFLFLFLGLFLPFALLKENEKFIKVSFQPIPLEFFSSRAAKEKARKTDK